MDFEGEHLIEKSLFFRWEANPITFIQQIRNT